MLHEYRIFLLFTPFFTYNCTFSACERQNLLMGGVKRGGPTTHKIIYLTQEKKQNISKPFKIFITTTNTYVRHPKNMKCIRTASEEHQQKLSMGGVKSGNNWDTY